MRGQFRHNPLYLMATRDNILLCCRYISRLQPAKSGPFCEPCVERYNRILLDVWREACRHIEIADATDRITPLIVRQLPLDQLVLRIIDLERGAVDTVAATSRDNSRPTLRLRTECTRDAIDQLFQWCRAENSSTKIPRLCKIACPAWYPTVQQATSWPAP